MKSKILFFIFTVLLTSSSLAMVDLLYILPTDVLDLGTLPGDGVGNGGGEDKRQIINAEAKISNYANIYVQLYPDSSESNVFLQELVTQAPLEKNIVFRTAKEDERLLVGGKTVHYFYTGTTVGSDNVINTRTLKVESLDEGFIWLMSLYGAHYNYSDAVKAEATQKLVSFAKSVQQEVNVSEYGQNHLQALIYQERQKILLADGLKTQSFDVKDLALENPCSEPLIFSDFTWQSIHKTFLQGRLSFSASCREGRSGAVEFTLFYPSAVDLKDLMAGKTKLQVKEIQWQTYYF